MAFAGRGPEGLRGGRPQELNIGLSLLNANFPGATCTHEGKKMVVVGSSHPSGVDFNLSNVVFYLREANKDGKVDLGDGEPVKATLAELNALDLDMAKRPPTDWVAS